MRPCAPAAVADSAALPCTPRHRVRLAHASSELGAEAAATALGALALDPEGRQVLVRSALISTWLRANRTGTAIHAAPESGVSSTLGNVFGGVGGVFNKVGGRRGGRGARVGPRVATCRHV